MLTHADFSILVNQCIKESYEQLAKEGNSIHPLFGELLEEMGAFTLRGGKRIRPYLAYVVYCGRSGKDLDALVKIGASLEIFHNFFLIHDDIIDRDYTRYGGPNIAGSYVKKLAKLPKGERLHFANMAALLAGDIASTIARNLIYDIKLPSDRRVRILHELTRSLFITGGGEFVDSIVVHLKDGRLSKEEILAMYKGKTANYSFDLPLQIGLMAAGQLEPDPMVSACAYPLGIAYQMRDDYLGIFGSEKVTGKPAVSDIQEGKQTYLMALGLELATSAQRKKLEEHYGKSGATEEDLRVIRSVLSSCGAQAKVESVIDDYCKEANNALRHISLDPQSKKVLRGLIQKCSYRES